MLLKPDYARNGLLSEFSRDFMKKKYALHNEEDPQDIFLRVAAFFSANDEHAAKIYEYMSKGWFMPSTPILFSAGHTKRGLPISCFVNEVEDSFNDILYSWNETASALYNGGGVGSNWSKVRAAGERINSRNSNSAGIMPLLKVMESLTSSISYTSKRGSVAIYLHVNHPEILEFISIRNPFGGDHGRKCFHIHHAVILTDEFIDAVVHNKEWNLIARLSGQVMHTMRARDLMEMILLNRASTGEPYILFIDRVKEQTPEIHKQLGLYASTSNLCTEIVLPTGLDHKGYKRTAICCLSSLNLLKIDEWRNTPIIPNIMRFLDCVICKFCELGKGISYLENSLYSAQRERSVGLGVFGLHSLAQKMHLPFDGPEFAKVNQEIFDHIHKEANLASKQLAKEHGSCLDAEEVGAEERFIYKTAIAPTANISRLFKCSPGIEPFMQNVFVNTCSLGVNVFKNPQLEEYIANNFNVTEAVDIWNKIVQNDGSIQDLNEFNDSTKAVFKTAFEIDQIAMIKMAGDRKICQSQSLNVFMEPDVYRHKISQLHITASKHVKTMYYYRTRSPVSSSVENMNSKLSHTFMNKFSASECESCIG